MENLSDNIINKKEIADKEKDLKKNKRRKHVNRGSSTTRKMVLGFLFAIIIGTLLLCLPAANADGKISVIDSLFTATTSICVTGLVTVDTYAKWTLFGKIIILILIQLGGLGIIVLTSTILMMLGKKISLKERINIQDAFSLNSLSGMVKFVRKVVRGTFLVEGIGACLYMIDFIPRYGTARGIWYSVFISVSAFCNAGIDILGPNSLMNFYDSPLVLHTTMILIIMGGLGYVVWFDIIDVAKDTFKKKLAPKYMLKRLSIHSKIVLTMTVFLIVSAFLIVLGLEYNNPDTIGNMTFGNKVLNSMFQSVTLRTAGFASFSQGGMHESTIMASIAYMLIGGSPAGTAGGIKTVTAAVLMVTIASVIGGRHESVIYKKSINPWLIRRALAVTFIMIIGFVFMSVALMVTNGVSMVDSIYEVASALGTVGLSRGITSGLNVTGKLILILGMFLGRIGPISMFIAFNNNYTVKNSIHYSEANIIVG